MTHRPNKPSTCFAAGLRKPVTALTTLSVLMSAFHPALAQIAADPRAAAGQRAGLEMAANGTPIVNIATPDAGGLSVNKFTDFNVTTAGVVLNNSTALSASQIAGLVLANPNLRAGAEASLILNEVTSTNRSQLAGYMEVHGRTASVVVANPNGITCSGCGFINMPRATLTTGAPVFDAQGGLAGFAVADGNVRIEGAGLDASRLSQFEIVSRAIDISAALHARDLLISGGRQQFNYAARTASAVAATVAPKPEFYLDSTAIGGMYANLITIVGNEHGLGVRAPGELIAQERLTIQADGAIHLTNASASGPVELRSLSGDVSVSGLVYSDTRANLTSGGALLVGDLAVLGAKEAVLLSGRSLSLGKGVIAAGLDADGSLASDTGTLSVEMTDAIALAEGSLLHGGAQLSIRAGAGLSSFGIVQSDLLVDIRVAGDITHRGVLRSQNDIAVSTGGALRVTGAGLVEANRDLALTAAVALAAEGAVRANRDVWLDAGDATIAQLTAGRDLVTMAGHLDVIGQIAAGGTADFTIAGRLGIGASGTLASIGDLGLRAASIDNAGALLSEGNGTIAARGAITNRANSQLAAAGLLNMSFAGLDNGGIISGDVGLRLTGTSLVNEGELLSTGQLVATLDEADNAGIVSARETMFHINGELINRAGSTIQAKDALLLRAARVRNAGNLVSAGRGTIGADTLDNSGQVLAQADLGLAGYTTGSAVTFTNAGGRVGSVEGDLLLTAGSLLNQADLLAGRDIRLTVAGTAANGPTARVEAGRDLFAEIAGEAALDGTVQAAQALDLTSGALTTTGLLAARDLRVTAATLDNDGTLTGDSSTDIVAAGLLLNRNDGVIAGGDSLGLGVGALDNAGALLAEGDLSIDGALGGGRNSGRIAAGNRLEAGFATLRNSGLITSVGLLALNGGTLDNAGELTADGLIDLDFTTADITGMVSGADVLISADRATIGPDGWVQANDLAIEAGDLHQSGLLASGGALTASVATLHNDRGLIIARGDILIGGPAANRRATLLRNAAGSIESVEGNIVLLAETLENVGDGEVERRTTEIRHGFAQSPPPGGLAFYPDLISGAGYNQLYDGGRTRSYVWVPSPEMVQEILTAEGITIDQWTPDLWRKYAPNPATFDPTKWAIYVPDEARHAPAGSFVLAREERDTLLAPNTPGRIVTGNGNIAIDAGELHNKFAVISANGNMQLTGGSVTNEGAQLASNYSLSLSYLNDTVRGTGWSRNNGAGMTQWFARGNPGPLVVRSEAIGVIPSVINATGTITGNLAGAFVNVGSNATDPATLSFADTSSTRVFVQAAPPPASVAEAQLRTTATTSGEVTAGAGAVNGETRIAESTLKAFAPAVDGSRFVLETRLAFIDVSEFFGSDYFFDRLGTRPEDDIKALGDAYFDVLLIREQILALTGERFLDPAVISDREQVKQLLISGADTVRELKLAPGVGLLPEQVAALTRDVVMYVANSYNGQRVLMPQLYLSSATRSRLSGKAAMINAADIGIRAGDIVNQRASINAREHLSLAGNRILDIGGSLKGNKIVLEGKDRVDFFVDMQTTGDGASRIGSIIGGRSLIQAGEGGVNLRGGTVGMQGVQVRTPGSVSITADTFALTPAESEIAQRYKDDRSSYDIYSRTLIVPEFTIGGDLNIDARNAALIRAATLNVGNDIKIHAGELIVESGETVERRHEWSKKSGFKKSERTSDYLTVTQVPTIINADGTLTIETTVGDTTIRASVIKADQITIDSAGKVTLGSAMDVTQKRDTKTGSSIVWASSSDKGIDQALVVQTELRAPQGVKINAQDGIVIEVRRTGDLQESIDMLAQTPGLAWMSEVANQPGVRIDLVKDSFREWNNETSQLSGPAMTLIALAVAVATAGGGTPLIAAAGSVQQALFAAAFKSLVTQATIGLINGRGDPLEMLKSLTSSEYARSLAAVIVTAGLLNVAGQEGLFSTSAQPAAEQVAGIGDTAQSLDMIDRLQNAFVTAGIETSVDTVVQGGSFRDNLALRLRSAAIYSIGAEAALIIGDAAKTGSINETTRLIAQGALGCGLGAATSGNCGSGTVAAIAAEIAGDIYGENALLSGRSDLNAIKEQGVNIAALAGGITAAFASGDVSSGAAIAKNAAENNALGRLLVTVIKLSKNIIRKALNEGKLTTKDLKDSGLDELLSIADDAKTIIDPSASLVEKSFAVLSLATGVGKNEIDAVSNSVKSFVYRRNVAKGMPLASVPGRVQGRINLMKGSQAQGVGWDHVVADHFNAAKAGKSQFSVSPSELRDILQTREVVGSPVVRVLESARGPRYIREVTLDGRSIGTDVTTKSQTSTFTIMSDKYGNLITTFPGRIK